jgi:hypothetical protein
MCEDETYIYTLIHPHSFLYLIRSPFIVFYFPKEEGKKKENQGVAWW